MSLLLYICTFCVVILVFSCPFIGSVLLEYGIGPKNTLIAVLIYGHLVRYFDARHADRTEDRV
jgi:hypothetical protein